MKEPVPHEYRPFGVNGLKCRWCIVSIDSVAEPNHCATRAAVDPKYNPNSPLATSQWSARFDTPLNVLVTQMVEMDTAFAEIPMGPYILAIVVSPPDKHPQVREAIIKIMQGGGKGG